MLVVVKRMMIVMGDGCVVSSDGGGDGGDGLELRNVRKGWRSSFG